MTMHGGRSSPLGATVQDGGVNFSVFSRSAAAVELLLFDRDDDGRPAQVIPIDPVTDRSYHYWHAFVPDVRPGQIYGFRVHGPSDPAVGMRFDPDKVLLDPYGRGVVVPNFYSRTDACERGDNAATAMKSVVVDPRGYHWEGDAPLRLPSSRTIIYEMHVLGFTRHPSSGVAEATRGTFAGLIEKIPHLCDLGVTAVELLPVFQFDAQDCPPGRVNYCGYSPVSFFAPHAAYGSRRDPLGPVDEFRDMVKALHRAGIEVILDVVFNHTAEGDQSGPTLCFRGIDNPTYYILEKDRSRLRRLQRDGQHVERQPSRRPPHDPRQPALLGRGNAYGRVPFRSRLDPRPRFIGPCAAESPGLVGYQVGPLARGHQAHRRILGRRRSLQVGSFIGDSWKESNGRFRDDMRSFFRGEDGFVRRVADRFLGGRDIYGHEERDAELPPVDPEAPWRRWIDTARDSPNDIVPWETAGSVAGGAYRVEPRSVVLLFARAGATAGRQR